ncbi:hypothetical protein KHX94_10845 [Shewanella dokdonensis]|uniref:Aerotolerance regulator N-terminal domain-containing protein n=1 Tax=Shewanella dokdonensis TaxID=712036 RepID=A0ABX8DDI2_9GAMM|nr:hypothetical protein [Shewanella dokdonensis]QVK21987.1 hypothetical protein KHX94_10845 [Shewanella dokdonensis]
MSFSFLSPWWSVLLLLLPLLWFRRHQLRHAWLPWVRSLVAALLVLALMQPVWVSQRATSKQVVIVDLSESVGSQGLHVPRCYSSTGNSSMGHYRQK